MISLRLNIGCGPSGLKSWLNYDWGILPLLSKLTYLRKILIFLGVLPKSYETSWSPIRLVDIRRKFPLKDNTVKYIYCSHVLEHFERWEGLKILKECRRVLQKNGIMRIVVPDIEKMLQFYYQTKKRSGRELCCLWWGYDKDIEPHNLIQRFSRRFIRDHQWNYDKYELEILLREAGFLKIEFFDFRKGIMPDIKYLDLDIHKIGSLFVEVATSLQKERSASKK